MAADSLNGSALLDLLLNRVVLSEMIDEYLPAHLQTFTSNLLAVALEAISGGPSTNQAPEASES
ncbi:hypothetical protein V5O48_001484, partial [Marasmius crinis-equi]